MRGRVGKVFVALQQQMAAIFMLLVVKMKSVRLFAGPVFTPLGEISIYAA